MARICQQLLDEGVCSKTRCAFDHPTHFLCDVCEVNVSGAKNYLQHQRGQKHQKNLVVPVHYCDTCDRNIFGGQGGWQGHRNSQTHRKRLRITQLPAASWQAPPVAAPTVLVCSTCDIEYPVSQESIHLNSAGHKRKVLFAMRRANLAESESNKHGVTVSLPNSLDFGLVELASLASAPTITLSLAVTLQSLATVALTGACFTNATSSNKTSRDDT